MHAREHFGSGRRTSVAPGSLGQRGELGHTKLVGAGRNAPGHLKLQVERGWPWRRTPAIRTRIRGAGHLVKPHLPLEGPLGEYRGAKGTARPGVATEKGCAAVVCRARLL